ncbi:YueI family protein [Neobacillus dielmonensis]|uniref:YueI family protein n=1 Tax=Neobacillus dielmonensis TaxID=1347369 RepID=UPI0005AB0F6E|nr:YueI family protein [Neobacillus dielmonensis]
MKKQTVEQVLQQGIYGPLETKPEERRKFLGTIRERIVIALNKSQVAEGEIYPQVEQSMKKHPDAHLYLNGTMDYQDLSKYVKLATKHKIEHTIVNDKEHETEIGLVLAVHYAIEKEEIFISKKSVELSKEVKKSKGLFGKLFGR